MIRFIGRSKNYQVVTDVEDTKVWGANWIRDPDSPHHKLRMKREQGHSA